MAKGQTIVKLVGETNDYERKMKQANKTFNDFMKGVGMSPAKFNQLTIAIAATSAAMKVAKDAFFANEQQLDEWGRIVESSKSIYKGFLDALNNGDISGFLSNIRNIVSAARDAYDALDDLNTFNAFNRINLQKARTGFTESIVDFREGKGSKTGVQDAGLLLKSELKKRQIKEQEAYDQALRNLARQRGVSYNDLKTAFSSSSEEFDRLKGIRGTGGVKMNFYNLLAPIMNAEHKATNDAERLGEALNRLNDKEIDHLQALGERAHMTQNEIANIDKQIARITNGRGGGAGGSGGGGGKGGGGRTSVSSEVTYANDSIAAQEQLVAQLTQAWKNAGAAVRDEYKNQLDDAKTKLEQMLNPRLESPNTPGSIDLNANIFGTAGKLGGEHVDASPLKAWNKQMQKFAELRDAALTPEAWQAFDNQITEIQKKMDAFTGKDTAKETAASWQQAANAVSAVGSALQTIENPAVKIAGLVGQAIANIALGFAQATASDSKYGVFGWIAAIAGGLATMTSTIAAIKSATAGSYAYGGIVSGHNFSGDNNMIAVNSGELVLTRAMQGNLAAQLSNNSLSNLQLSASLSGETIYLAVAANNRRRGRGEFATTKNRHYGNMDS